MNPKEYIKNVLVTESGNSDKYLIRTSNHSTIRLLHSALGITSEAGEFADALKKHIFYGKEIDRPNLKEELGDLMWYIGVACDELGISLEDVMETNIKKLRARYGGKFSEEKALNRNLDKERKILEGE